VPVDLEIFATEAVKIGLFRCGVDDRSFVDSGPTKTSCFVFPRHAFVIEQEGTRAFVADPTVATVFNRGQAFRRACVSAEGDRSDWFAVDERVLRDVLRRFDRRAAESERPLRLSHVACDAPTYARQRGIFLRVSQAADPVDALRVEEEVLEILDHLLTTAYGAKPDGIACRARRDIGRAAQEILGRRFAEPLTLGGLAAEIGCSAHHLSRSFRRTAGTSIHRYREQLRLRAALESLDHTADLTALALDLGYSSHSHFTARFSREFGVTPSELRTSWRR
jgi:AraC family transcriptional regulator